MSENRVADTRGRAESYPFRQYPDSVSYLITKAKIRVITEPDKKNALQYFLGAALQGTPVQRAVARYGMGLVYLETQQFDLADSTFGQLVAEYPNQPQYIAALARTAVENHNYEKANKLFANAVNKFPNNDPLKEEYIRSLLKSSQPQAALQVLENLSDLQKTQLFYFELMAQAQADLHHPGESHRYLAEYYYAAGQTDEAILQIRLARNEKDLSYQLLAIISDRLNFYLSEQEEHKSQR
jgi:predicted Zn-dependent protease